MKTLTQDLASSKKFMVTLAATLAALVTWKLGILTKDDVHTFLMYLFPAYLASQGLADFGKHQFSDDASSDASEKALDAHPEIADASVSAKTDDAKAPTNAG